MIMSDTKTRVEELRRELNDHNYRYYVLNAPTIGDRTRNLTTRCRRRTAWART